MKDIHVIRVLKSAVKNPGDYLRLYISNTNASIHLPDGVHLSITNAILAGFVGDERTFYYKYDASASQDINPDFKCVVAMKRNSELAYFSGDPNGELLSGYIRCRSKKKDHEDEPEDEDEGENENEYEDENELNEYNGEAIFFGVVTTKVFTIIFAADTIHSKTLQNEYLRGKENKPTIEDIILTLIHSNGRADQEVSYGQEEQEAK